MGLIMKKDDSEDNEYIDGIEVIGRGEGPDGDGDDVEVEVHEGLTAQDISGKTAAAEAERELEADPELLEPVDEDANAPAAEDAGASAIDANADLDLDSDIDAADETDRADEAPAAPRVSARDRAASPVKKSRVSRMFAGKHKLYVAGAVAAIVIAGVAGYAFGSGAFGSKGVGEALFAEDQLDNTVATWSYNGSRENITAREAIESKYSLDSVKDDDDKYPAPSADMILSYARNQVLLKEAEKQGIKLSDEDLEAAAEESLGTSDFELIASQYQVSEDQAKQIVRDQATIQKLYQQVVTVESAMPKAPEEPAEGAEATATADYAAYIIDLAGEEWDKDAAAWKDAEGTIASAFAGDAFDGSTATYEQAQKAYAAAYQAYAAEASKANAAWTEYVNNLFANADIELYGLFA